MKYDPNEPVVAWPRTKKDVRMSEVASWLSAMSEVLGACITKVAVADAQKDNEGIEDSVRV